MRGGWALLIVSLGLGLVLGGCVEAPSEPTHPAFLRLRGSDQPGDDDSDDPDGGGLTVYPVGDPGPPGKPVD